MKDTEQEAYEKGEYAAMENHAGISTSSCAIANPYDSYTDPELSYAFESGFNSYFHNIIKKQEIEGSFYSENDPE